MDRTTSISKVFDAIKTNVVNKLGTSDTTNMPVDKVLDTINCEVNDFLETSDLAMSFDKDLDAITCKVDGYLGIMSRIDTKTNTLYISVDDKVFKILEKDPEKKRLCFFDEHLQFEASTLFDEVGSCYFNTNTRAIAICDSKHAYGIKKTFDDFDDLMPYLQLYHNFCLTYTSYFSNPRAVNNHGDTIIFVDHDDDFIKSRKEFRWFLGPTHRIEDHEKHGEDACEKCTKVLFVRDGEYFKFRNVHFEKYDDTSLSLTYINK